MAISKIQFKASAQDTPVVWMDVTQKTVTAGTMLNGTTALKNDGTDITGNIVSKTSSDLTANVLTVTAPAGHYASAATKTLTDQYLLAENIRKDISIFGVTGTYEGGGGGSTGLEYETGTYTPVSDIARPTISFANTHNDLPFFIMMTDANGDNSDTTNTNLAFYYIYHEKVFGEPFYTTETSEIYGLSYNRYKGSSSTSITASLSSFTNPDSSTTDDSGSYPRYYTKNTEFYPYTNGMMRNWKAGRTYKWIAIWKPST